MRRFLMMLLLLVCLPACAFAAEGDPLLSVDDLLSLEDSYDAFLDELEELIVERGLLSPEEREAWRDAQMGDFYQNGGYGSILVNYMPGVLSYIREEETLMQLSAHLAGGGTLYVDTMRRYTPQDSSLSGLMLTLSMTDESGVPLDVGLCPEQRERCVPQVGRDGKRVCQRRRVGRKRRRNRRLERSDAGTGRKKSGDFHHGLRSCNAGNAGRRHADADRRRRRLPRGRGRAEHDESRLKKTARSRGIRAFRMPFVSANFRYEAVEKKLCLFEKMVLTFFDFRL